MTTVLETAGPATMSTGIVSVGLAIDGRETLSLALFAVATGLAAALWVALAAALAWRRQQLAALSRTPVALTWVAATAVVGTHATVLGLQREAQALFAVAIGLWLIVVPRSIARIRRRCRGSVFLFAVATEAIAVLAARLAGAVGLRWLAVVACCSFILGLALYGYALAHFDLREVVRGRGDHWIAGGGLAIASLACARCLQDGLPQLRDAALALWCAAVLWLPALAVTEIARRRPLLDSRRWSTVFPLGMYAVCSFAVSSATRVGALQAFASAWIWIAAAAWAGVAAATVARTFRRS